MICCYSEVLQPCRCSAGLGRVQRFARRQKLNVIEGFSHSFRNMFLSYIRLLIFYTDLTFFFGTLIIKCWMLNVMRCCHLSNSKFSDWLTFCTSKTVKLILNSVSAFFVSCVLPYWPASRRHASGNTMGRSNLQSISWLLQQYYLLMANPRRRLCSIKLTIA